MANVSGGTIKWTIVADGTAFRRELDSASNKARNFGSGTNKVEATVTKAFEGMARVVRTVSLAIVGAGVLAGRSLLKTASDLETTNRQMAAVTGSTKKANKVFGELYQFTLGKPITFPDASKSAQTLLGYGVSTKDVIKDMKALSAFSIVNGADMSRLALAYGQVQAKGKLMGQEVLQLTNNFVPVSKVIAKHFNIPIKEAQQRIESGEVSAKDFRKAMSEFIPQSDIKKQSDTFKNRMITLQGSLRSLGLSILGIKIDPIKGFVVEAGGLFDRISKGIETLALKLKDPKLKAGIKNFVDTLVKGLDGFIDRIKEKGFALATSEAFITMLGNVNWTAITATAVGLIIEITPDIIQGFGMGLLQAATDNPLNFLALFALLGFTPAIVTGGLATVLGAIPLVGPILKWVLLGFGSAARFALSPLKALFARLASRAVAAMGPAILGQKALLASRAGIVGKAIFTAMMGPIGLLVAAAAAAFAAILIKARQTMQTLQNTQNAVVSASNSDDAVLRRLIKLKKTGTPAQKARAEKTIKGLAEGGSFAHGTMNAPGGLSLVGEQGPELVYLPKGSKVDTARKTERKLGTSIHIGVINIAKEVDGERWIKKLTRDNELLENGLVPSKGLS